MRRADRLFQIVQLLRRGRLKTAKSLADVLEVSERTIYRDVAQLINAGVPIDGAAGAGYLMRSGYDIPPMMFSRGEIDALVIGARMAQAWAGTKMGRAASAALDKIEAVAPEDLKRQMAHSRLFAPDFTSPGQTRSDLDLLHQAIEDRRIVDALYARPDGPAQSRRIRPLGLFFWGKVWTLAGWCELRGDFRSFRVDRFQHLAPSGECFTDSPQCSLAAYLQKAAADPQNT